MFDAVLCPDIHSPRTSFLFILYPWAFLSFSRGHVRESFIRTLQVALGLGLITFVVHALPLRLLKQVEVIDFVLQR